MTWRHLTTRDPIRLKSADDAPCWLPATREIDARVVVILGEEDDAPIVVQLHTPSIVGLDEAIGLHLTLVEAGAQWQDAGVVEVRRFQFPLGSPSLREGTVSSFVEGQLTYERWPFDLAEVFAEADGGGGSRMISSVELSQLVDYARTHDAAVTSVEAYELRGALEIPRVDLSIYGLDGNDEGLSDTQRIDLAAGYVSEMLALAEKTGHRFGYRVWVWPNADR
ncbi:hypothetical protein [Caulobacter sp. RL271]|jgi:hypothetical protein|uniref:Uncharacterized protein n=1 Tax=Caulobacter segnis TaxID=88688 RepID=A0ABY4ZW28_9CAUL|nr:hypothetical protein [Caulobacter segnis]USQ96918.1 hypothetical protein MZV50_04960 [Caulobacter segnis]